MKLCEECLSPGADSVSHLCYSCWKDHYWEEDWDSDPPDPGETKPLDDISSLVEKISRQQGLLGGLQGKPSGSRGKSIGEWQRDGVDGPGD